MDETLRTALLPELELIRLLGSGASADVFLAREPALQRLVAVKVLRAELCADAVVRQRFEREAQSAARITHPHVTAIHRVGRLGDDRPYIVMEYVEGRTLADMLSAGHAFDVPAAIAILAPVASALAAAHARGIIHRDVRPGNVLVEHRTGRAVLGDFGIAALLESGAAAPVRLTAAGVMLGDTRYLSPEQVRADPVVEQSDVYAFGLLAFELLAGRSPYDARNAAEYMAAHLRQEPKRLREFRPDAGPVLDALVARCLAREAAARPLAGEVAAQLAVAGAPGAAAAAAGGSGGAGSRAAGVEGEGFERAGVAGGAGEGTGIEGASSGGVAGGPGTGGGGSRAAGAAEGSGEHSAADADPLAHFLAELRRRHVYQVLAAYGAVALAVLGIAQGVYDAFDFSRTSYRILVSATLAGFPLAMVLAWVYDIRAGRVQRTQGMRASKPARMLMWAGLAVSLLVAMVAGWFLLRDG
jgi:tRNA A-37 threonylcarbamoyl transferase component Bud32